VLRKEYGKFRSKTKKEIIRVAEETGIKREKNRCCCIFLGWGKYG
jgi:hypothetical protein